MAWRRFNSLPVCGRGSFCWKDRGELIPKLQHLPSSASPQGPASHWLLEWVPSCLWGLGFPASWLGLTESAGFSLEPGILLALLQMSITILALSHISSDQKLKAGFDYGLCKFWLEGFVKLRRNLCWEIFLSQHFPFFLHASCALIACGTLNAHLAFSQEALETLSALVWGH